MPLLHLVYWSPCSIKTCTLVLCTQSVHLLKCIFFMFTSQPIIDNSLYTLFTTQLYEPTGMTLHAPNICLCTCCTVTTYCSMRILHWLVNSVSFMLHASTCVTCPQYINIPRDAIKYSISDKTQGVALCILFRGKKYQFKDTLGEFLLFLIW